MRRIETIFWDFEELDGDCFSTWELLGCALEGNRNGTDRRIEAPHRAIRKAGILSG